MKQNLILIALVGLGLLLGCEKSPSRAASAKIPAGDLLLRSHFIGTTRLFTDTNAAKLKQIWALPDSAVFREQTLDKLARAPFLALGDQLDKGADDQAAMFRPLLDDLLAAESFVEWRGPVGQPAEFALAVQIEDARAKVWQTNLRLVMTAWKLGAPTDAKAGGYDGWEAKKKSGANLFSFTRAGQWVVVGFGSEQATLRSNVLAKIKADGRPIAAASGYWLDADGDLERWKKWMPALAPYQLPAAHLTLNNKSDYVRTTLKLTTKTPHGWKSEPWLMPTNLIRDPLISFTTAQGIAPLLQQLEFFQKLNLQPLPNQFTAWTYAGLPFLHYASVPALQGPDQMKRMTKPLNDAVFTGPPTTRLIGSIDLGTNGAKLTWHGLPFIVPWMEAVKIKGQEYFVAGLFPPQFTTNAVPPDLFAQVLGRTNLAYYDWEITQEQLGHWRALNQLGEIVTHHPLTSTNLASQKWDRAVAPLLGNTATEVTVTSPSEFTLVRKSHLGLTGFELVTLARWLESVEFPKYGYYPIPPKKVTPARPPTSASPQK